MRTVVSLVRKSPSRPSDRTDQTADGQNRVPIAIDFREMVSRGIVYIIYNALQWKTHNKGAIGINLEDRYKKSTQ